MNPLPLSDESTSLCRMKASPLSDESTRPHTLSLSTAVVFVHEGGRVVLRGRWRFVSRAVTNYNYNGSDNGNGNDDGNGDGNYKGIILRVGDGK